MSYKILPFLSLALVSTLLVTGPAFAAPNDTRPGADGVRAGQLNQPPYTFRPGSRPVIPDEVRHHMQSGPERMAPDRHPGWSDDRRPMPQHRYEERHRNGPRWNDERPVPPMPSRHHYQPDPRGQHMRPMPPARSNDNTGHWVRPYRDDNPVRPGQPDRSGTNGIPFRYHR